MPISYELICVLIKMEGEIAKAAKNLAYQYRFPSGASRSQFELAVEGAQQTEALQLLQAFLAYQANPDKQGQVWGRKRDKGSGEGGKAPTTCTLTPAHSLPGRGRQYLPRLVLSTKGNFGL